MLPPAKILCLGDSLTAGQTPSGEFVRLMPGARLDGTPLASSRSYARRLRKVLGENTCAYDAIVVLGGTNDLWRLDPDRIVADLAATHDLAATRTRRVVPVTIPPFDPRILRLFGSSFVQSVDKCRQDVNMELRRSKCLFDLDLLSTADPLTFRRDDGIHFSKDGYLAFGSALQDFLLHDDAD